MSELADFLVARSAEVEAIALDKWRRPHLGSCNTQGDQGSLGDECDCAHPERVLAWCDVVTALVANERLARAACGSAPVIDQASGSDGLASAYWRGQDYAVRLIATLYADHPDYDGAWRV